MQEFCLRILRVGDLPRKLESPAATDFELGDEGPPAPILIDAPARDAGLTLSDGGGGLPRPGALMDPAARAQCLARFAHHELMAVELFAWALLRWPDLPDALRGGWLRTLADEQRHCRLYVDRLEAHGARFEDFEHSDYFWKQAPAIAASPHGARAFLAAMGLTLEQANLDFTLTYRDAFRSAGDEESAQVCQRVHDDEIEHVRLAATWLARLSPEALDEVEAYEECVPFPLSAARAKGKRFDLASRERAGLGRGFIEHVRVSRSTQELSVGSGRRPSPPGAA